MLFVTAIIEAFEYILDRVSEGQRTVRALVIALVKKDLQKCTKNSLFISSFFLT